MHIEHEPTTRRRLSLTSLIDVIFLLLLFFMLSSTFSKFADVKIGGEQVGKIAAHQEPRILVSMSGEMVRVNGEVLSLEDAVGRISGLVQEEKQNGILLTQPPTTSQQLISALERLNAIPGFSVTVSR